MSQEGGSEQRTVAELLAKYGGSSGESAPRRRRRKPEDGSDTAPQAIIERVMSDSGKMLPITEDQGPHERVSHRQGRTPQPPKPAPQRRQPAPTPPPELLGRPPGLEPPPVPHRPAPPRGEQPRVEPPRVEPPRVEARVVEPPRVDPPRGVQDSGRLSRPVSRPMPGEGHTEQIPRVPAEAPDPAEPPAGLGGARRSPLLPRRAPGTTPRPPAPGQRATPQPSQQLPKPPVQPTGSLPTAQPSQQLSKPQPSQPMPVPQPSQQLPVPQPSQQLSKPQPSQQLPKPQPSQALPKPQPTGQLPTFPPAPARPPREFPGDAAETAIDQRGPRPEFLDEVETFDDRAASRFTGYQAHDDLGSGRRDRGARDLDDRDGFDDDLDDDRRGPRDLDDLDDDLDDRDLDDLDEDADDAEPVSAGREWAIMAGQLALGVVGGAAVWLGFNWLWGFLPAAALIAAVVVIVGLVLIVRKIRRAEDLQTTVLAVLVGLVVTVSPAVLLLLGR
ncbi:putative exported protein of unknown function with OmpA family domain [Alloactinosynnema sp. L-07]|uniref:hypothetical protein n=1 Tax=Alloactinosynnema sp. L-07 TaxID=1653480 RepID=UPI00065EFB00|nr:hypothetical protein [Alloactinosynnema sp. L-07]CRK60224.1 putative exported protein of unknown function with OmpA family domain [Alloactinosynnema sp. L-07]